MATYVMVHGAWLGSSCLGGLAQALRATGHTVFTPSLTGLGERAHLAHGGITLTDHINDAVGTIDCEGLSDIVLVGHSYGGMVITGVAAARGDKIRSLVYLDAFLPEDGQALWDIADDAARAAYIDGQRGTPGLCRPFFELPNHRASAHPLLTLLEPVRLTGAEGRIATRTYVYADGGAPTVFTKFRDRVAADPAWRLEELKTRHILWDDDFDGVLRILLDAAR